MEANRRLVELGGKPQPGFMGGNQTMVFGSFSMGTPNGGRPSAGSTRWSAAWTKS
jgi:hypothetical protein